MLFEDIAPGRRMTLTRTPCCRQRAMCVRGKGNNLFVTGLFVINRRTEITLVVLEMEGDRESGSFEKEGEWEGGETREG